jgi:hypothetical protein
MKNTIVKIFDENDKLIGEETLAYLFENCYDGCISSLRVNGHISNMRIEFLKFDNLIAKYRSQKSNSEKYYGQMIRKNHDLINGCCAMADVKARMDCIQQFYSDLINLKK